jgi:hypothetical protein
MLVVADKLLLIVGYFASMFDAIPRRRLFSDFLMGHPYLTMLDWPTFGNLSLCSARRPSVAVFV